MRIRDKFDGLDGGGSSPLVQLRAHVGGGGARRYGLLRHGNLRHGEPIEVKIDDVVTDKRRDEKTKGSRGEEVEEDVVARKSADCLVAQQCLWIQHRKAKRRREERRVRSRKREETIN